MKLRKGYPHINNCSPRHCISSKVKRLDRITSGIFRKYLSPFNITDSQLTLFFLLAKLGPQTQKELAEITKLEKSSINRNLKRLIDNGYFTKEDFPQIKITSNGLNLLEKIVPEWKKAMAEIKSILHDDGEEALNKVLNKLSHLNQ